MTEKPEEQPKEKVYLLTYSLALGTKEQVKNCLDQIPQIKSWRTDLPSSFYIISECQNANELASLLVGCIGKTGRFLIVQITPNTNLQGWLMPDTWHFMKRKTAAEAEAEAEAEKKKSAS